MLFYPSAAPVWLALAWPSNGFDISLMIGALGTAAVLAWLVWRERTKRPLRVEPVQLVPRRRHLEIPRAAA